MDGYRHYIRLDENNIVVHRFSDAFETPQEGDICVAENAGRHYNEPYINERGQYMYQWNGSEQVERSQTALNEEWDARPPAPPTDNDRIVLLRDAVDFILMNF